VAFLTPATAVWVANFIMKFVDIGARRFEQQGTSICRGVFFQDDPPLNSEEASPFLGLP